MTTRDPAYVRNAVELAGVSSRSGQTREPVTGVVEVRLVRGEVLESACGHVLRHLGVSHLDDVSCVAAGERRVELLQVRGPRLVLHVDVPPRVALLELRVHGRDQLGPAVLCVVLQPDRKRVGGAAARSSCRSYRRNCERGYERGGSEMTNSHAHLPWHLDAPGPSCFPTWQSAEGKSSGLYQSATSGEVSTSGSLCQEPTRHIASGQFPAPGLYIAVRRAARERSDVVLATGWGYLKRPSVCARCDLRRRRSCGRESVVTSL